ncbi:MAG: SRPBCC domain-containing protein [Acidobacteria bacterium]|nr:SRPBCC domain-containing protein [Acidobacteriota bacterium]
MKTTLNFTQSIRAPRARVWDTMIALETYKLWTAAFGEGSTFEGSWASGAKIRFVGPSGDGMTSEIAENRPGEFLSIRHLGEIQGGVEITDSEAVKAWAPAYENYGFSETPEGTLLEVSLEVVPEWESFMRETFPKALQRLKALCELNP